MKKDKISFQGSIFFHLGFPKTGTMAIQNEVFPNLQGVEYLGMSATKAAPSCYRDFTDKLYPNAEFSLNRLVNQFAQYENRGSKTVLISHVFPTNPENLIKHSDYDMFFKILSESFANYKVIFTIRRPSDLLKSLYLHENNGLDIINGLTQILCKSIENLWISP